MRRLLFSASLLIFVGCSSRKSEMAKPEAEPRPSVELEDAPINEPTPEVKKAEQQTTSNVPQRKTAGKAVKSESTTEMNDDHKEMPSHGSPDQEKIDSIKQAKQKDKK